MRKIFNERIFIIDKLQELVIEFLKNGVPITGVYLNDETLNLEYELQGFSKSNVAILTKNIDCCIILKTRYGEVDQVDTFDDIAYVAKRWQQYQPDYYELPKYFDIS